MPRSRRSLTTTPRRRPIAAVLALLVGLGGLALLPTAGADGVVLTQVASRRDAGVLDRNGDGTADVAPFGPDARALAVGEQPRDGSDLRLVIPFRVSSTALDAVQQGGTANVAWRVRRVSNLGDRHVVVDATATGMSATLGSYRRAAMRLATVTPIEGRMAVDVSGVVRAMTAPGVLTLRLRLDAPAPHDGLETQVVVPMSETRDPAHRPLLSVSAGLGGFGDPTVPTTQPTPPPAPPPITTPPTTVPVPPTTQPAPPPASDEVFRDDFDGSRVDLAKWRPNWLAGDDSSITKPVNSAELSCYDPAQVSVSGGYLHLRAVDRPCRANNGVTYRYASGLVESAHDFTFTYGRIEARIWLPPGSGAVQNWPAFWANGTGPWPVTGELDVMEGLSGRACWHFHSTAGGPGGCAPLASAGGWHTFAAEWRPGAVTFLYDGAQVGRIASGITASPMYLVLNLAVSNEIAPPAQLPSEMLVDWVRVTR